MQRRLTQDDSDIFSIIIIIVIIIIIIINSHFYTAPRRTLAQYKCPRLKKLKIIKKNYWNKRGY